ncbi:MAG TPA: protein kinase family protein, partial [Gemmataceae bacterium]|nr:protein kinase family protein [Gemmataceae bacterium]
MTELKHCPKCGAPIPSDARWGICPKCLLEPGAQAPVDQAEPFSANFSEESRRFADYELVRQIGRGGMGVVYEAFHLSLRRTVAIKMILDAQVYSPAARRRFAIEAEAAAKLDHPNIVPIYEVGEHLNQPFLSMKLV